MSISEKNAHHHLNQPVFLEGDNRGVLLLHSFANGPYEMRRLVEDVKPFGYTISVPLLAGHGKTPKALNACTWYDWFLDAKEALFKLRKTCSSIVVIGQSMGGSLALHLAAHYRTDGIVGLAPGLFFRERKTALLPFAAPFIRYRRNIGGPDIRDEKAREEAITYEKTPIRAALELKRLFGHLKSDLPEIYSPALLIHSKNDHVIDYKSTEYIYTHISSTHKRILSLEESYHLLTLDVEKQLVNREIIKFIKMIFDNSQDSSGRVLA